MFGICRRNPEIPRKPGGRCPPKSPGPGSLTPVLSPALFSTLQFLLPKVRRFRIQWLSPKLHIREQLKSIGAFRQAGSSEKWLSQFMISLTRLPTFTACVSDFFATAPNLRHHASVELLPHLPLKGPQIVRYGFTVGSQSARDDQGRNGLGCVSHLRHWYRPFLRFRAALAMLYVFFKKLCKTGVNSAFRTGMGYGSTGF